MPYEVFEAGPAVYVPYILISLVITLIAYGAFPLIYARARRGVITRKKYRRRCFAFNLLVMIGFCVINGGFTSWAPYLLWTTVFSSTGINTLINRGRLGEPWQCAKPKKAAAPEHEPPEASVPEVYDEPLEGRISADEPLSEQRHAETPVPMPSRQETKPKRGQAIALVAVCVLLALSLSLNAAQYFGNRSAAEISSERAERVAELSDEVDSLSASNTILRDTLSSTSQKADYYDFICLELGSGEYGYASDNFNASESVIVLGGNEVGRKFTLTANWPSGGTVQYFRSGTSANISFDSQSWQTSTTMTVSPVREGITTFRFWNSVDSNEFKLMVIVTD